MDPLVDIDGVLSGHHLVDGRPPLLFLSFLSRGHLRRAKEATITFHTSTTQVCVSVCGGGVTLTLRIKEKSHDNVTGSIKLIHGSV